MKVCDKCHREGVLYSLVVRGKKAELCADCSDKVVAWLKEPVKSQGFLQGVLGR